MTGTAARVPATVRRIWPETTKLTGVVLEVPEEVARAYEHPGQYVVLHPANGGKKVFLVIASCPGEACAIELLLGPKAVEDLGLAEGARVDVDPPAGKGFGLDVARGRDVFLFGTGSGIAAIRPIVEVIRRARGDYGRVTFYAGAHTEHDFPYAGAFSSWSRDGIELVRATSRPWVQELFERQPVTIANGSAFVCGQKEMMEATTAALVRAGIPVERIRRNF